MSVCRPHRRGKPYAALNHAEDAEGTARALRLVVRATLDARHTQPAGRHFAPSPVSRYRSGAAGSEICLTVSSTSCGSEGPSFTAMSA